MGFGSEQQILATEQIGHDYDSGEISTDEAKRKLKELGFDPQERDDFVSEHAENRMNAGVVLTSLQRLPVSVRANAELSVIDTVHHMAAACLDPEEFEHLAIGLRALCKAHSIPLDI